MKYVPVIEPSGKVRVYTLQPGRTPTLEWLQAQVGGWIEPVRICLHGSCTMLVNEEGRLLGLPFNSPATELSRNNSMIVGDAVVMKAEGNEFVPLDPDELKLIVAWCAQICAGDDTREIEKEDEE